MNKLRYLWLRSLPARGREPVEVRIPVKELANEIEEQLPRADVHQDLPRAASDRDGGATSHAVERRLQAIYRA